MTLAHEMSLIGARAREASRRMARATPRTKTQFLFRLASLLEEEERALLAANARDLDAADARGIDAPRRDRLRLTPAVIAEMARACRHVADMDDPIGATESQWQRPNGLLVGRMRVPLGVVAMVYEARPNVTVDVAALCLRTGNVAVLKGGKEAARTNAALGALLADVLRAAGLPEAAVTLLPPTHEAAEALMAAEGLVDALIPRGSARLIEAVRRQARVPVIETGAGVCHVYVHEDADLALAARVIDNAKTRRVSVCNALDCVLVHRALQARVPELLAPCRAKGVHFHEAPEVWGHEWLSMNLSVRVVDSLDAALDHIARYGSGHSEAIVTESPEAAERFRREVDAACVYVNTPTSFTDGGEFGLGAEVGISTQKLHARGPMGLAALTTYKWLIESRGALRP